jgi:hypothetical protein
LPIEILKLLKAINERKETRSGRRSLVHLQAWTRLVMEKGGERR